MQNFSKHLLRTAPLGRSSHRKCSVKNGVLKNFAIFPGTQCQISFLKKLQARPAALLMNFAKFLKIPIWQNICERLLLAMLPFSSRFTQCRLVIEDVLIKGITNFGEFFENNSKEPHPKYFIGKLNFIKSKPGVKIVQIRSFFWSVFFHIRTEYCISPYSVQMRENTDQKNSVFGYFSRSGGKAKKGT